jgi:RNA polymerase sigma factor (TIGR02999 family)
MSSRATQLIAAVDGGDAKASAELLPLVYDELRQMARQCLAREREGATPTLQATALVHEAYLRLVGHGESRWNSRRHFFAAAAEAMRRILIDRARGKNTQKRGTGRQRIEFAEDHLPIIESPLDAVEDVLVLDTALGKLEAAYPEQAQIVKLLYFAGLSLDETAATQGVSRATVHRHWVFARAWLHDAMIGSPTGNRKNTESH